MAEDIKNPRLTSVGIDIDMTAAALDLRVNDVPVFDPGRPLETKRNIRTQIPMNPAFAAGENTIQVRVKFEADEGSDFKSGLKIDFGYWPILDRPRPFNGRPMAAGLEITIEDNTTGMPVMILGAYVGDQPYMRMDRARLVEGTGVVGTWNTYEMNVDLDISLPSAEWLKSSPLPQNEATRTAVLSEFQDLHRALDAGMNATKQTLAPFIARQAAAIGSNPEEFANVSMRQLFDSESGFELIPFDTSGSELTFFGEGRLATFVPLPNGFRNEETGQQANLFVYYWRDAAGNWQVIH